MKPGEYRDEARSDIPATSAIQVMHCIRAALIPLHEQYLFGRLSGNECATLYRLLCKFVDSSHGTD
jgi:hypothetical protein